VLDIELKLKNAFSQLIYKIIKHFHSILRLIKRYKMPCFINNPKFDMHGIILISFVIASGLSCGICPKGKILIVKYLGTRPD